MELNKSKILEILRKKNCGISSYQIRKEANVTERRVNQIWQEYCQSGEIPRLKKPGRPKRAIEPEEIEIVKQIYATYRVSASLLQRLIERDHNKHIPHNHIHKIMLQENIATQGEKVIRKKKWIRYERRHSLTAVHIDWHQRPMDGPWVFAVEDDASRALLALIECDSATTEKSIEGMNIALGYGQIKQCISDHGAQFTSNNGGDSRFESFLEEKNIQQILCRIKHPQSNGKVEKWFNTYERNRDAFKDKEEFKRWYNEVRPHWSLNVEELETPWQAFQRKMRI